jgi:hypothetical protein
MNAPRQAGSVADHWTASTHGPIPLVALMCARRMARGGPPPSRPRTLAAVCEQVYVYDRGVIRSFGIALAAAAVLVSGCGDVDRDSYVKKNVAVLKTVPTFPGARPGGFESGPYKGGDNAGARTIGYGTTRIDTLPGATRPAKVIAFYRRALRGAWQIVDDSAAPSLSLRKGDAYLHVLPGGGEVYLEIDHDCYKGGSSPRCFGP